MHAGRPLRSILPPGQRALERAKSTFKTYCTRVRLPELSYKISRAASLEGDLQSVTEREASSPADVWGVNCCGTLLVRGSRGGGKDSRYIGKINFRLYIVELVPIT